MHAIYRGTLCQGEQMYKINIRAVCARRRAMIPESHKSGHRGSRVEGGRENDRSEGIIQQRYQKIFPTVPLFEKFPMKFLTRKKNLFFFVNFVHQNTDTLLRINQIRIDT